MNIKAQKAKQKLQDIAKKTAKDVGYELGEIPKRTPGQITVKDTSTQGNGSSGDEGAVSPIIEAMQQRSDNSYKPPTKDERRKFIKDKSKVDADIEKYRNKRKELEKEWEESNKAQEEEQFNVGPGQPLDIPTSKPARGKTHPGKQKSPEKRLGKK